MKNGFCINEFGIKIWLKNNKRNRLNGPAVIRTDARIWIIDSKYHRINGPSIMYNSPTFINYWYINDTNITDQLYSYCISYNIDIDDYMNLKKSHKLKLKFKFGLLL